MRDYDSNKDGISLEELNDPLAQELRSVIAHMSNRDTHVTDEDRIRWDNKLDVATGAVATEIENGLLSAVDKKKLNSIAYNANFYEHPKSPIIPGTYNQVVVNEYGHIVGASSVTSFGDAQTLGGKDASQFAPIVSPTFRGIPLITNTPNEEDIHAIADVKFVRQYVDNAAFSAYGFTADDVANWNAKWDASNAPLVSQSGSGIMSAEDKRNLDNLVMNVTGINADKISSWDSKLAYDTTPLATQERKGFMSSTDKKFLDSLSFLANVGQSDVDNWNQKLDVATGAIATENANGLMSKEDRKIMNNLGAAATIKIDDIANWNQKLDVATGAIATLTANGLMSSADRKMLNDLKPSATIQWDDIERWNNKQEALDLVTSTNNGIMSADDKRNLDALLITSTFSDDKVAELSNLVNNLAPATADKDGLMAKGDKSNLDFLMNQNQNSATITRQEYQSIVDTVKTFSELPNIHQYQVDMWTDTSNNAATKTELNNFKQETTTNLTNKIGIDEIYTLSKFINMNYEGDVTYTEREVEVEIPEEEREEGGPTTRTETVQDKNVGYVSTIFADSEGAGFQRISNTENYIIGINDSNDNIQIAIIDKENSKMSRLVLSKTNGLFYIKDVDSSNMNIPENSEVAIMKDVISNAQSLYNKIGDLDSRLSENLSNEDTRVIGLLNSMDDKFTNYTNSTDNKFTSAINEMGTKITQNLNAIEDKYSAAVSTTNNYIASNIKDVKDIVDSKITEINTALARLTALINEIGYRNEDPDVISSINATQDSPARINATEYTSDTILQNTVSATTREAVTYTPLPKTTLPVKEASIANIPELQAVEEDRAELAVYTPPEEETITPVDDGGDDTISGGEGEGGDDNTDTGDNTDSTDNGDVSPTP